MTANGALPTRNAARVIAPVLLSAAAQISSAPGLRASTQTTRSVQRGGLFAAASCTGPIGPEEFREVLAEAADHAKRRFQIVHEAGQAIDHPVTAQHVEGRYLKFVVGRVQEYA